MEPIFSLISNQTNTFKDFRVWLFTKLGKNENSFRTFGKYPNSLKIPYLLEYLESKGTPIVEALVYYMWKGSEYNMKYEHLATYLIREEFKRIEQKRNINFIPF